MFVGRRLRKSRVLWFGVRTGGVTFLWASFVYLIYAYMGLEWLRIPFAPLSVMGIAVSFYVGFKNNSAYDRFWEARKIWGGIVNESRAWASTVLCYVLAGDHGDDAQHTRRELIMRHLGWVNALRLQLRETTHLHNTSGSQRRLAAHAQVMRNDWESELTPHLGREALDVLSKTANPATHLLHWQGQQLAKLQREGRLDLFHQLTLMSITRELYALQGRCERIKNTPLPRQYAEYSHLFIRVFVGSAPFGLLDVFEAQLRAQPVTRTELPWLITYLGASALIGWVFLTMEKVGDASEDPFERSMNDVPMNSICRAIERDLLHLLGDEEVPASEQPIDGILY